MTLTLPGTAPGTLLPADSAEATLVEGWRIPQPQLQSPPLPAFFRSPWTIPQPDVTKAPALMARLRQLKAWTGWSSRTLAEAIGTTHPTVEAILRGDSQLTRLPQVARRVATLYELAARLYMVVGEDPNELDRVMRAQPSPDRASPFALLGSGDPADAYLAALDVITPPRTGGMMRGRYPARPGEATVALDDE